MLLHEVSEELDWRAAVDLVQHAAERRLSGCLGVYYRKVDVRLPFTSPVGDVALELERSNHAGDAGVGQVRVNPVPDFGRRRFLQLPEHAHDVQLALGEMEFFQRSLGAVVVDVVVTCAWCPDPTIGWGIHSTTHMSPKTTTASINR